MQRSPRSKSPYRPNKSFQKRTGKGRRYFQEEEDMSRLQLGLSLLFWPIALSLKVVNIFLSFSLGSNVKKAPSVRTPSQFFMKIISLPFRLLNPATVIGAKNFVDLARFSALTSEESEKNHPRVPVLFVGNSTYQGLDHLPILYEISHRTGICPHTLYESSLDGIPFWTSIAESFGGIKGTTGRCGEMMSTGQWQLIYPGGSRDFRAELRWKTSLGFVRMAIRHGAVIVPFACTGIEESMYILGTFDLSWWLKVLEINKPGIKLPLFLPINKLQRQYFAFGKPIPTDIYEGDWECAHKCTLLYQETKNAVEKLLPVLSNLQSKDPNRYVGKRILRKCLSAVKFIKSYDSIVDESDSILIES